MDSLPRDVLLKILLDASGENPHALLRLAVVSRSFFVCLRRNARLVRSVRAYIQASECRASLEMASFLKDAAWPVFAERRLEYDCSRERSSPLPGVDLKGDALVIVDRIASASSRLVDQISALCAHLNHDRKQWSVKEWKILCDNTNHNNRYWHRPLPNALNEVWMAPGLDGFMFGSPRRSRIHVAIVLRCDGNAAFLFIGTSLSECFLVRGWTS